MTVELPVWAYVLSSAPVGALIAVLGVLLTNRFNRELTERQLRASSVALDKQLSASASQQAATLTVERERLRAERSREHAEWQARATREAYLRGYTNAHKVREWLRSVDLDRHNWYDRGKDEALFAALAESVYELGLLGSKQSEAWARHCSGGLREALEDMENRNEEDFVHTRGQYNVRFKRLRNVMRDDLAKLAV